MEKRKAAMWKEAAMPSASPPAMPSAVLRRTMHRGAMPATNRPRLRRSPDQCDADRDRRRETSQFPVTRETSQFPVTRFAVTHRRAPKTRSPHANEVAAAAFIPCAANQISEKTKRKCTKVSAARTGQPDERQFMRVRSL
jgi:hypothetical protein